MGSANNVVPGATHLFEEPGTMAQVERLAAARFVQYLRASEPARTYHRGCLRRYEAREP
jgi:hypothetical protein